MPISNIHVPAVFAGIPDVRADLQCYISASRDQEGNNPIYNGEFLQLAVTEKRYESGGVLPIWFHFGIMNTGWMEAKDFIILSYVGSEATGKVLPGMSKFTTMTLGYGQSYTYSKQLPIAGGKIVAILSADLGNKIDEKSELNNSAMFTCSVHFLFPW